MITCYKKRNIFTGLKFFKNCSNNVFIKILYCFYFHFHIAFVPSFIRSLDMEINKIHGFQRF